MRAACRTAEMVSPMDLKKACLSFETLQLPLRVRNLKSGVTVIESGMATEEQVDERMKAAVADKGEAYFNASYCHQATMSTARQLQECMPRLPSGVWQDSLRFV